MGPPPELVVGSVRVSFIDDRSFVFRDLHDPQKVVTIQDVDAADLISFLVEASRLAKERLQGHPHGEADA
jgi:hypothetical protein